MTLLILGIGLLTVSSVATSQDVSKQVFGAGLMIVPLIVLWFLGRRKIYALTLPLYLISLGLLALVSVIGVEINGNRNWFALPLPGFQFQFQPLEFGKIAMILMLARYMRDPIKGVRDYVPVGLIVAPMLALVLIGTGDTGGALVLVAIIAGMLMVRGMPWRHVLIAAVALIITIPVLVVPRLKPYQIDRLTVFLNPDVDPRGKGYQYIQSRIAIGSGGLSGKGYKQGTQSQGGFVPADSTDFIFAPWAEEQGFIGAVLLLACYAALFWRVAAMGGECQNSNDRLVIAGVLTLIGFQVLENIGAAIGVAPLTGLTLPLVSYGVSSLLATATALGIVYVIHRDRYNEF